MRSDGQENQPLIEGWSFHSHSLILWRGEGLEVRLLTNGQWIVPVSWRLHKTQLDETGRTSRLVNTEHRSHALPHTSLLCAVPQLSLYCCSVAQSCPALCDPMNCSVPSFPVLHYLPEFAQTHVHWVGDGIQPSHPLLPSLLLLSIFPSIRVFSNELALHIRWTKYWSCSISSSNEYSGLIFFRIDWFDLQGTLKKSSPTL